MTNPNTIHVRRGATVLEAVTALALLTAGLVFTVQVLATCAENRHATAQTLAAQVEAANIAERIALVPYDKLNDANFRDRKPSEELLQLVPKATLKISVADSVSQAPPHKRLAIRIEWTAADETTPTGVTLTTWRYNKLGSPTP